MTVREPQIALCPSTRRRWRITGQVQGVGFRPFVYRLATKHGLTGFVGNDARGVCVEAQGPDPSLDRFVLEVDACKPALAQIHTITAETIPSCDNEEHFAIQASEAGAVASADVTVDAAVCPDCLRELQDAGDRRFGYGLINCTNCGPRYSIVRGVPYDRPNTTMAGFEMCPACQDEYANPADRRFHAQPIACHACGPKVELVDTRGIRIDGDPIRLAAERLMAGRVLAIKGLGGFHLACRADDSAAVARLRELKHRDHKPFAIMCRDLAAARLLVNLSDLAAEALSSPACPIILSCRREGTGIADSVAPDNHRLGVLLPNTPIQHLLFSALSSQHSALVMTSGNVSDEPLVIDNVDAVCRLGTMCDAILWHDRPIERPVDDSVMLDLGDGLLPIRRARGYVPGAISLPAGNSTGLCVGGELKNTVAVVRDGRAILSHHVGGLTHPLAYAAFEKAIEDMCQLFGVRPQWIAHDLHPVYLSTQWAQRAARKLGVPLIGVQHHHAHAAAVMAEHGITGPVLAVVCDGVGYGTDGTMWGGELLKADLIGFERLAHLRPMVLAGGDAAARDGRRCALGLLHQTFGDEFEEHPAARKLIADDGERAFLSDMIQRGVGCAISSGAGRVFDGVAALIGLCARNTFEAQAAMRLESAAAEAGARQSDPQMFDLRHGDGVEIDLARLIRSIVERAESGWIAGDMAACFHEQFAWAWDAAVADAAKTTGLDAVVLSGGVFCNERLTKELTSRLQRRGLRVLRHRQVPPNDGGLSLGQAAVAAARTGGQAASGTRRMERQGA